jgi:hypothetical protein
VQFLVGLFPRSNMFLFTGSHLMMNFLTNRFCLEVSDFMAVPWLYQSIFLHSDAFHLNLLVRYALVYIDAVSVRIYG